VADLVEIQQVLYRYCFAHDAQDTEMLATVLAEDVKLLGAEGRDNVVARYAQGYKTLTKRRRHLLTNVFMVEDGETEAIVQSYVTLYLIDGDVEEFHLTGRYRDHVVLEDGQWRIRAREAVMDVPYTPGDAPASVTGRRS
jgi:hypothetical protein